MDPDTIQSQVKEKESEKALTNLTEQMKDTENLTEPQFQMVRLNVAQTRQKLKQGKTTELCNEHFVDFNTNVPYCMSKPYSSSFQDERQLHINVMLLRPCF